MSKENKENNTEEKEAVQSKEAEKSSKDSSAKDASAAKASPEEGEKSEKAAENATDSDKIKALQDQVEELMQTLRTSFSARRQTLTITASVQFRKSRMLTTMQTRAF